MGQYCCNKITREIYYKYIDKLFIIIYYNGVVIIYVLLKGENLIMSYATKYNKGIKFTFKTADDVQYVSLEELYKQNPEQIHDVKALYINTKSRFGDAPCVAVDPVIIVNLPKHLLETVKEMISDNECVDAINNNEVKFKIYSYNDSTFNKTCYSVEWL